MKSFKMTIAGKIIAKKIYAVTFIITSLIETYDLCYFENTSVRRNFVAGNSTLIKWNTEH